MSERDDDSVGRVILGRYRVVLPLGRGGQGAVYLARGEGAEGFARPVVVKRILAPLARDPVMLEQFAREARITAQLRHPSIVPIIDFARDRDSHVMVLEYVHGYDLRRWERYVRKVRGHFPPELVVFPLLRVLDALHYAHTLRGADGSLRSVIHRDISPANVLIDVEGHVKLTDFGIARMADEELTQDTSTVKIKGKLPYLAPEMFRGERASELTDLYACGVVLHELLSGKNEFFAPSAVESMARVTGHVPTRLDQIRDDLPEALSDIAERALAKDPEERFQSAAEFAFVLRAALSLDDHEIHERFRSMIFEDFHDPRLAQMTGSRTLGELDAAWRNARSGPSLAEQARAAQLEATLPETVSGDSTLVDHPLDPAEGGAGAASKPPRRSASPAQKASSTWPMVVAFGAALGVGGFFLSRMDSANTPQFVYVDKQEAAVPAAKANTQAATQAATPAESPEPPTDSQLTTVAPSLVRTPAALTQAERLTQAFMRHRAEVERCFAEHDDSLGKRASLAVQFSVDKMGRVLSASIVPDNLTRTAFGRCVTRIAGEARFGPQPGPIAFRIPITARTVGEKP